MTQLVAATLQRLLASRTANTSGAFSRGNPAFGHDIRSHRPDFADTRPVVFRSEAFAEDLVHSA